MSNLNKPLCISTWYHESFGAYVDSELGTYKGMQWEYLWKFCCLVIYIFSCLLSSWSIYLLSSVFLIFYSRAILAEYSGAVLGVLSAVLYGRRGFVWKKVVFNILDYSWASLYSFNTLS